MRDWLIKKLGGYTFEMWSDLVKENAFMHAKLVEYCSDAGCEEKRKRGRPKGSKNKPKV